MSFSGNQYLNPKIGLEWVVCSSCDPEGCRCDLEGWQARGYDLDAVIAIPSAVESTRRALPGLRLATRRLSDGGIEIELGLGHPAPVEVRVCDVGGRTVRTVADRTFPTGTHRLLWRGERTGGGSVVPGIYFVVARTPDGALGRKVLWLR